MDYLEYLLSIGKSFWTIDVQVLPVVLCIFMLELHAIIRHIFQIPYVPIYFALHPFNVLNRDLSIYLNEDYFYQDGENLSDKQLKQKKAEILRKAYLSIIISLSVIPFIGGFIAAFFLPTASLTGFCLIFVSYKLIGIIRSAVDFSRHSISNWTSMLLYLAVYTIYFTFFLTLFYKSHHWTSPYVEKEDWSGLLQGLRDVFVVDIISANLLLGGLITLFIQAVAKKEFREKNHEVYSAPTKTPPETKKRRSKSSKNKQK